MSLIVPITGDRIKIADDDSVLTVSSYTNLKQEPAVYIDADIEENNIVYFFDITEINGVSVYYNKTSKVFESMGLLKRKINIPQPGDILTLPKRSVDGDPNKINVTVKSLKLHNKVEGVTRGLVVIDEDDSSHDLLDIQDIKRVDGTEFFNKQRFQKLYFDYLPYQGKKKSPTDSNE